MEITIHIPPKHKSYFTIFVKGNITYKVTLPPRGTLIKLEGIAIVYYKYSSHRRAYIIYGKSCKYIKNIYLPNIKKPIGLIYYAHGRKIDLLRQAVFNLEKMSENKVYKLPPIFWQKVACLIDNYNGYKSAAIKSNLMQLYDRYKDRI